MSYIQKILQPNEEIILKGQIHWLVFVPFLVSSVFLAGAVWLKTQLIDDFIIIDISILLLGVITVFQLLKSLIKKYATELIITNKRVVAKFGLIRRNTIEIPHSKVESIIIEQGIIDRIFNCGTLVIQGMGNSKTPIPLISKPLDFRNKVMEIQN
jgi:uncharacterized membrane protein YdbT with pleckstrin-like domain